MPLDCYALRVSGNERWLVRNAAPSEMNGTYLSEYCKDFYKKGIVILA
jgi:hypothetical protein